MVGEPTVEDTISILRGLKDRYEQHHRVRITDAALVSAADLSNRYISDRFLPDKAIDLVDEAASRLRIRLDSHALHLSTPSTASKPRCRSRAGPHEGGGQASGAPGHPPGRDRHDAREARRHEGRLAGAGEGRHRPRPGPQGQDRGREDRDGARDPRGRPAPRLRAALLHDPRAAARLRGCRAGAERQAGGRRAPEGGGHLRGDRRGRERVDRRPGVQDDAGRDGQAQEPRGRAAQARHRPGRGRERRGRRRAP